MSREKQIEEMARDICGVKQSCNDVCHPINSCRALKYAERFYDANYRKQEWISVEERLPEDGQIVLTIDSQDEMEVCFYETTCEGIFQQCGGLVKIFNITHWMPLPEPPKMKGGEG